MINSIEIKNFLKDFREREREREGKNIETKITGKQKFI